MKRALVCSLLICTFASSHALAAQTLFEAYFKATSHGTHVGYVIERLEYDSVKSEFTFYRYTRSNEPGERPSESQKLVAALSFAPISYKEIDDENNTKKESTATYTPGSVFTEIKIGTAVPVRSLRHIPNGAIFQSLVSYYFAKNSGGLKKGVVRHLPTVITDPENLGVAFDLRIDEELQYVGLPAFKVSSKAAGDTGAEVAYINSRGDLLGTSSADRSHSTEIVASMSEAVGKLKFDTKEVTALFGSVPKGAENPYTRAHPNGSPAPPAAVSPIKK